MAKHFIKKIGLALATVAMLAASTTTAFAAKPDPDNMPEIVICDTVAKMIKVYNGEEPFCLFPQRGQVLVPIRDGFDGWYWQLDILDRNWDSTEICDNDGYLGFTWWRAYRPTVPYPSFMPNEYLPENCVPGTYIWELRWEERADDGEVSYYTTEHRRWVIPGDDK